jgi:hypothetical protein
VLQLQFSGFGNGFGLTQGHTVRANAFPSKIKGLPHIGQFHAPAVLFAGRCPAIELRPTFIASELLHRPSS